MPLPSDPKLLALSENLLKQFDTIFGLNPGFRPAHAKGLLLSGTFTPAAGATELTRAPHITRPSTPVVARFSDSTGIPLIPDNDPNANPRGLAVRFMLAEHVHTDIVAHSTDGFPTHTGDEFLEFLRALATSDPANLKGSPLEAFLGSHPAALAFVQAPKPAPSSFARESYYGVTAMRFTNQQGKSRYGRYRILPAAGNEHLDDATTKAKSPNYLFDELPQRLAQGAIVFHLKAQLAAVKCNRPVDVSHNKTRRNRSQFRSHRSLTHSARPPSGHCAWGHRRIGARCGTRWPADRRSCHARPHSHRSACPAAVAGGCADRLNCPASSQGPACCSSLLRSPKRDRA